MRIVAAQINSTVGDIDGNVRRILAAARVAAMQGADAVAFPEMCKSAVPKTVRDAHFVDGLKTAQHP